MIDGIKDGGHIHEKLYKYCPKVLNISEEDEESRKNQPEANIEENQKEDGIQEQNEFPGKGNMIHYAEHNKYT